MATNKDADLLKLIRGESIATGLQIVTVDNESPVKLVFEGSKLALDADIFVIPACYIPLQIGDKFLSLPIASKSAAKRWGLLQRLNR